MQAGRGTPYSFASDGSGDTMLYSTLDPPVFNTVKISGLREGRALGARGYIPGDDQQESCKPERGPSDLIAIFLRRASAVLTVRYHWAHMTVKNGGTAMEGCIDQQCCTEEGQDGVRQIPRHLPCGTR